MKRSFEHVKYLWQDEVADRLGPVDRLVYRSNKLGEDLTLTNTGGGNTSSKIEERDPLTGEPVEVLWIKGSGGDLRTTTKDGLASLYLDKVRAMKSLYLRSPGKGPKTQIEDDMYPMYRHCVFNLNPRACSIDTPLHTLVPYKHVDHLHPNAVIALAASVNQKKLVAEVYGDDVLYVPWQRPGFDIGLLIEDAIRAHPSAKGCVLGHHGMSAWANDDRACYETSCPGCAVGSASPSARSPRCRMTTGCCGSWAAWMGRGSPRWAPRAPITSCAPRSSRCSSTGSRTAAIQARSRTGSPRAWSSIERTTSHITSAASAATRRRFAIPIPRSC
jgi:hypothetical protein